jgi:hypothetical protein
MIMRIDEDKIYKLPAFTMRKGILLLITTMVCCTARAQQTASASTTAGATITTPTSILKSSDMEFEEIKVSSKTSGKIVIQPTPGKAKDGEAGAPASFTVSAPPGYTYNITLPQKPVVENDSLPEMLKITNFTSYPPPGELTTGTKSFSVGATVDIEPAKENGQYEAEIPFDVTIGYN